MSVYQEMIRVAETLKPRGFLDAYLGDLDIDRDVIEGQAVAGDEFIWIVKDSGCGTHLLLINGKTPQEDLLRTCLVASSGDPESEVYHIVIRDAQGNGTLKKVGHEKALALQQRAKPRPGRIPKKEHIRTALSRLIHNSNDHGFNALFTEKPALQSGRKYYVQVQGLGHYLARTRAVRFCTDRACKRPVFTAHIDAHAADKEGIFTIDIKDWPMATLDQRESPKKDAGKRVNNSDFAP